MVILAGAALQSRSRRANPRGDLACEDDDSAGRRLILGKGIDSQGLWSANLGTLRAVGPKTLSLGRLAGCPFKPPRPPEFMGMVTRQAVLKWIKQVAER